MDTKLEKKEIANQNGQQGIIPLVQLPTLAELIQEDETSIKENKLMVLLNQEPPRSWVKLHPIAKIKNEQNKEVPLPYLPINRVEYLLSRIYTKWWVEIRSVSCIANSVQVTVRLYVKNPVTGEIDWNDGLGAVPIQTDAGKGAMDWNFAKAHGVQIAAPAAETYATKDAAEKFGKIFGKDLARKDAISYNELLKQNPVPDIEELKELFELKKESLSASELKDANRIIKNKETGSYRKLKNLLSSK